MNDKKLRQLFGSARNEPAPAPGADFSGDVLRAIRREPLPGPLAADSTLAHLNNWFPRVAVAACAVIVLCVAADWGLTEAGIPGINDGTAQVASDYLFELQNL